jgi:hypothetical protein
MSGANKVVRPGLLVESDSSLFLVGSSYETTTCCLPPSCSLCHDFASFGICSLVILVVG